MTNASAGPAHDIAIVGGGAAGVLVALQLLRQARHPLRVVLVEPRAELARGVAYSTPYSEHVLNVPAQRMSAFNDRPDDFLDYIAGDDAAGRARLAPAFVERCTYGRYLAARLQEAIASSTATLDVIAASVSAFAREESGLRLTLHDGRVLHAQACVLAVGNRPRPLPARGVTSLREGLVLSAWDFEAVRGIPVDANLCVVGSGLSMVDAVLSFVAAGHRGRIQVLSRHGLRPLTHAPHAQAEFDPASLLPLTLRARIRRLRRLAAEATASGLPWQAVMERLRPHGQALWRSLSRADQRRFLRHAVRLWDVHRHRIAAEVDARIQTLIDSGQLRFQRARLDAVMQAGRCVRVTATAHGGRAMQFDVDHVVNATGVELRVAAMRNPLLSELIGEGHAQPGPHGIGIASDDDARLLDAHGRPQDDLRVIGSLRIGDLWETIAIPELRGQAEQIARQLLGAMQR